MASFWNMSFHHLFLPSVHFSVRSDTSAVIFYLKTLLVCSHRSGSGRALAHRPLLPLFYSLTPKLSSLELKSNLCASKWSLVLPKSNFSMAESSFSMAESSFLPQIEPLSFKYSNWSCKLPNRAVLQSKLSLLMAKRVFNPNRACPCVSCAIVLSSS